MRPLNSYASFRDCSLSIINRYVVYIVRWARTPDHAARCVHVDYNNIYSAIVLTADRIANYYNYFNIRSFRKYERKLFPPKIIRARRSIVQRANKSTPIFRDVKDNRVVRLYNTLHAMLATVLKFLEFRTAKVHR